jgi:hypothetical protein
MNQPNPALMEKYKTSDVFEEKLAGHRPISGRVASSLLARVMQENRFLAGERHRQEAEEMNARFRVLEHARMQQELEGLDHTHTPMFVPAGSDLPAGWDEGMVRLASVQDRIGRTMAKLALSAMPLTPPKPMNMNMSTRGASPMGMRPPARASQAPTNAVAGGVKPAPVSAFAQPPAKGRVPTPTQAGVAEINEMFKSLDPAKRDVLLKHPLVAGGHMTPEAAFQVAHMSIPHGQEMTLENLQQATAAGRGTPPSPRMANAPSGPAPMVTQRPVAAQTPAPAASAPGATPRQQTQMATPMSAAFKPAPTNAAPVRAGHTPAGTMMSPAVGQGGTPNARQPAPVPIMPPRGGIAATSPGSIPPSSAPPSSGPVSSMPPPSSVPPSSAPPSSAPPSSGPVSAAPLSTQAPGADNRSFLQKTLGNKWARNATVLGGLGAGAYAASRLGGAVMDWGNKEPGPQTFSPPGMYQVPMGVNSYGQPQPGSPLY